MNKKVSILIASIVLALVIFGVTTNLQKELVSYVPTMKCLIATRDIAEYEKIEKDDFQIADIPMEIVANVRIIDNYEEIQDLYLKSSIYKGQIILYDQFASSEDLMIIKGEEGKEKISIKIKASENGASYVLKKGSMINVYATVNNEYASSDIFKDLDKLSAGNNDYGYSVFKILDNVKILGTFDENGEEVDKMPERNIDTILISVLPEEAYKINLIRELAVFNVTEL